MFDLTDEGWRKLTWRWAFFFFALAVLNEIVWRNFSTDVWVSFKLFGVVPLTFLFGALQYPLLDQISRRRQRESVVSDVAGAACVDRLAQIRLAVGEEEFFEIMIRQARHRQEGQEGEIGRDQRQEEIVGMADAGSRKYCAAGLIGKKCSR